MRFEIEPSRLSLARRRKGWSRPELSKKSGIPARTIAAWEAGERQPTTDNFRPVARALEFPMAFFTGSPVERLNPEGVSFRAITKMTAGQRDSAIGSAEMALMLSDWLRAEFDLPNAQIPELSMLNPEEAASEVRVAWGLGSRSIGNLVHLLESKGVRVFSLAEDNLSLDGLSFWRGAEPFIFLNTMKSAERSRFDAAHELGHLVLHRHGQALGRKAEIEANEFASAFLMPRDSVIEHAPRMPDLNAIIQAKRWWGVSTGALVHRMGRLNLLSEWHTVTFWKQIQAWGYRTAEPDPMPREHSQIWQQVFSWMRENGMRRGDLTSALGHWPASELRGLVFQLALSAESGGQVGPPPSQDPGPRTSLKLVR